MRGEAGRFPLDDATVRVIGRSLARQLASQTVGRAPRIITGRDTRESGAWLERALIAGAIDAGAACESAGVITTPGVAYLARTLPADAGIVISASHNPYHDNGIKIFAPSGRKLDDETERLIEADIAVAEKDSSGELTATKSVEVSEAHEVESDASDESDESDAKHAHVLQARYLDYLIEEVAHDISLEGASIVVDCANGASAHLAPHLFERLGARVTSINCAPDGRNINLNCGSLHIEGLQRKVVEEQADLGIAFDGDADRALFVDASGGFVDGDATLWVMAKSLHAHGNLAGETVVATVMSNIGLEIALRSRGISLLRTDVGDKYVLEKLLQTGASVGGEQSGHIIFPHLSLAGDGMLTTIRLLGAMRESGESLQTLTEGFERYPQVLVNVRVREKLPFTEVEAIARAARSTEEELGANGRLLLRYSGTEPLARVMIEGERQDVIERQANQLAEVIRTALGTS